MIALLISAVLSFMVSCICLYAWDDHIKRQAAKHTTEEIALLSCAAISLAAGLITYLMFISIR